MRASFEFAFVLQVLCPRRTLMWFELCNYFLQFLDGLKRGCKPVYSLGCPPTQRHQFFFSFHARQWPQWQSYTMMLRSGDVQVGPKPGVSTNNLNWHTFEPRRDKKICLIQFAGFPPHLENLEKQDPTWKTWKNRGFFFSKNLEKYCKTWKKILTSPWKSPKDSTEKVSKKKAQARGPRVFFVYLDKGLGIIGFY